MSQIENDSPAVDASSENNLREEIASLRQQVWTVLVLLVIISGTFSIYLMRQVSYARKDLTGVQQLVNSVQGMDQFVQRLGEYSRSHPDFVPILNKYGITMITPPPQK